MKDLLYIFVGDRKFLLNNSSTWHYFWELVPVKTNHQAKCVVFKETNDDFSAVVGMIRGGDLMQTLDYVIALDYKNH